MTPRRRLLLGALAAAAAAPAAVRAAEERKKGGGASYIQFPTLTAPLLRAGANGVLTAEAGVDTPDPALKAKVDLLQPRLRDAYNTVMAQFAAALSPGAPPDVEALVQRLQAATDRVVGRPGARFLIGTVIVG